MRKQNATTAWIEIQLRSRVGLPSPSLASPPRKMKMWKVPPEKLLGPEKVRMGEDGHRAYWFGLRRDVLRLADPFEAVLLGWRTNAIQ
mgnify:FL=1